jgi:hypothetical protein
MATALRRVCSSAIHGPDADSLPDSLV